LKIKQKDKEFKTKKEDKMGKIKWPSPMGSRNPYVVLVIDNPESLETKEAVRLLKKAGIKFEIEDNGWEKDPRDGPLPWLISASQGAFSGLDQIKWYVKTFKGTILAY
jgi:hypothetical protein